MAVILPVRDCEEEGGDYNSSVGDLGSGAGREKKSGSGMNFQNNYFESLETVFSVKTLKFFDADPDSFLSLDLGYFHTGRKNSDPG